MFPSISHLFLRWRDKGCSQNGWGTMAGMLPGPATVWRITWSMSHLALSHLI